MAVEIVVAAVILAFGIVWTAGVLAAARYGDRRLLAKRRVLVNLKSGEAVEGVVMHAGPEALVIADAVVYDPQASSPAPADGEVIVYRTNVAFTQRKTTG